MPTDNVGKRSKNEISMYIVIDFPGVKDLQVCKMLYVYWFSWKIFMVPQIKTCQWMKMGVNYIKYFNL